jgi:hypothetical protein
MENGHAPAVQADLARISHDQEAERCVGEFRKWLGKAVFSWHNCVVQT